MHPWGDGQSRWECQQQPGRHLEGRQAPGSYLVSKELSFPAASAQASRMLPHDDKIEVQMRDFSPAAHEMHPGVAEALLAVPPGF